MTTVTARRFGHRGKGFLVSLHAVLLMAGFALAAPAAIATNTVGTAPGQFSVSPTGAATYQIPIDVPPGVNGLKPSLALLYNSQAGNGLLGQGWSLSGLSVISHCPQTIDQDGVAALPYDVSTDPLCLDGQRLILTSGSYGAVGSTYRTEIDSFRVVTLKQAPNNVPTLFTVVDRSGLTSIYGGSAGEVAGGNGVPLLWLVTSITDRYTNFIDFQYSISNYNSLAGTTSWDVVTQINYGNANGAIVGNVVFSYSPQFRADAFNQIVASTQVTLNPVELTKITVQDSGGHVLDSFNLGYQNSNPQNLTTSPTLLTSVQECGSDGSCHPATTFNYQGSAIGFGNGGNDIGPTGSIPGYQIADFDGDGIPDYVFSTNSNPYVVFGSNNAVDAQIPNIVMTSSNAKGISLQGAVTVDLNGDGKQELMVPYYPNPGGSNNNPVWWVLQWNGQKGNNSNLVAGPVPTTNGLDLPMVCINVQTACIADAVGIDIHHTGQSSLFYAGSDGYYYYYANVGGKLSPAASPAATPPATNLSYMNDSNGVPPRFTPLNWQGAAAIYVSGQNIGYGGVIGWNQNQNGFVPFMNGDKAQATQVVPFDANGDGHPAAAAIEISNWCYIANKGTGFNTSDINNYIACASQPSGADDSNIQVIDWYGDGRQELIVPVNDTWYMFVPSTYSASFVSTGVSVPAYDSGSQMHLIDMNGDGQPDLVYTSNGHTGFTYNTFNPYLLSQIVDGLGHNTDVGYVPLGAEVRGAYVNNSNFSPPPVNPPQTRLYSGAMSIVKDFAVDSGVFDSTGRPQQIYTYYLYGGAAIEQWGRGFLGFSKVEAINFTTGLYTTDTYRQDFPFTGMVDTSTKTWNSQATLQSAYVSSGSGGVKVSCTGSPTEPTCDIVNAPTSASTVFLTGGTTISTTNNNYVDAYNPNNPTSPTGRLYTGVYSPYQSSAVTDLYDINTKDRYETTSTSSTYQVVGTGSSIGGDVMPTDITVTTNEVGNENDSETVHTQSEYITPESSCPGHPDKVTVIHSTPAVPNGLSQVETFGYDGKCFLTSDVKNIIDPAGSARYPMTLTKAFVPDSYGNPLQTKVSGSYVTGDGNNQRVTSMTYDPTERFPATITNALNQTETLSYDSWGNKLTDTDANGDTVSYTYDGFERKIKLSGPLPNVNTTWSYGACSSNCASGAVFQATQTGSDGSSASTQYDELARGIRSSHLGFSSGETINQDTVYDLLGRVTQTSIPFKSNEQTECWDTKTYDVLNRVAQETQPYGATTTFCGSTRTIGYVYDGMQTQKTVSASGTSITSEVTTTILNVLGKPSSVKDEGGPGNTNVTTSYAYDPWGNLTSVTPPDNTTEKVSIVSMTYDSIGDKLTMHDPDMGAWSYTYDALGELLTQTDAKGQTVTNTYDLLGRLVSRNEAEGETDWVYDIAYGAGVGKLAYTKGPGGVWEGYAYDGFGETTDKITVVGGQEYWVTNTYDDQGRVSQVVYPNMTAVNVSGIPAAPSGLMVAQVLNPDNSTSFNLGWQLNSASQNGQIFHIYRTPSNVTTTITTTVPAQYEIYSGPVPNWQDNTVTKDDTYTWWLQACNDANCSSYISQSLVVVLPPTVPVFSLPAAVESAMSWSVSWSTASLGQTGNPGPISYLAQVSYNGGTWTPLNATGTSATETSSGDGSYSYRVQACANGACSNFSAPSTETIAIQPSVPQGVTVPASVTSATTSGSVPVSWSAPAINGGTGDLTYTVTVFRNSVQTLVSPSQATTSYSDLESLDGMYTYQVTVCNMKNMALCANATSAAVPVTLAPTNPSGLVQDTGDDHTPTWNLGWNPSTTPGNPSGTVNYMLQQSWNGAAWTAVPGPVRSAGGQLWLTATAVEQSGYYQNGTYTYRLSACTSDSATGGATCTAWVAYAPYTTVIAPGVPTHISVPAQSNWDGSFTVTYSPPAAGSGGVVTSYKGMVYDLACTEPPNAQCITVPEATCTSTTTSCAFPANKLPAGNGYSLQIEALDSGQASPWVQENEPNIVYTSPPPAPTINETDASDGSHYTITYSASTATTYQLYFSSATKTGSWSAWTQVYSGSATSYYTGSPIGQYYLRYYAVACNQHAQCSPNSGVYSFTNPKEVTGCMTCSQTNPPTPAPAPGSTASVVSVAPERLAFSAHPTPATSMALTRVMAPEPELPALRTLALNTVALPAGRSLKRLGLRRLAVAATQPHRRFLRLARRRASAPRLLTAANLNPRQAYFLAHAGRTTAPKPGRLLRVRHVEPVVATARYAPPVDPILSLYPPLRLDPRVMTHFEARGGNVPVQMKNADVDCRDTDNDVECTTPDSPNALMVGYVYNSHGYLQKVEKLNTGGTAIAELWQATDETAAGQVDKQVFDAPLGSTSGAFAVNDSYDTASGLLNSTTATAYDTVGGSTVLNPSYTWDGYNNLLTRVMPETVPTGQTGSPTLNESFIYDAVNRVKQMTDSGGNSTTPTYDMVGAIQSNGLYTGYLYNNTSTSTNGCTTPYYNQVHAVSSLIANGTTPTTRNFCYDADGNLTKETGDVTRTLAWASYNKPNSITSGATTEAFTYGPGRERLQTTVISSTSTVTTTYIDGLFEQVQDSVGNITYKHYIIAGGARIGVETIATTSGTVNSDLLSFFVSDQVGGVIATVTEGLGGISQQLTVYSHDPWGKARPTSGTGANLALLPGVFQPDSAVMSGQHEGFAGHEDLEDIGIVDMEGRIYDPEVGRFLSPDPNVQFPDSSQGYNRYTYVNNNPLSLSDPTGYTSEANQREMGYVALIVTTYLCAGGCSTATALIGGATTGYIDSGGTWSGTAIGGVSAVAFAGAGGGTYSSTLERSVTIGLIGGAFSVAGGGRFSDGFMAGFVTSEFDAYINANGAGSVDYNRPVNVMERAAISAIVGGTVSQLTGGDFADGALVGAMQEIFSASSEGDTYGDTSAQDEGGPYPDATTRQQTFNEAKSELSSAGLITGRDISFQNVFADVYKNSDGSLDMGTLNATFMTYGGPNGVRRDASMLGKDLLNGNTQIYSTRSVIYATGVHEFTVQRMMPDGTKKYYPMTALDHTKFVIMHEVGHGTGIRPEAAADEYAFKALGYQ